MNPAPTASVGSGTAAADPPNPNHSEPSLRTLPFSSINVYKNGKLLGTVSYICTSLYTSNPDFVWQNVLQSDGSCP